MDSNNLNKYLTAYWTPAKCGKHTEIIKQHAMVLMPNLKVEPEDLFEQINENKFTFQNFKLIPWSDFLKRANFLVTTVGVNKQKIKAAHGLEVFCDVEIKAIPSPFNTCGNSSLDA